MKTETVEFSFSNSFTTAQSFMSPDNRIVRQNLLNPRLRYLANELFY